jgi:hypothetical protein
MTLPTLPDLVDGHKSFMPERLFVEALETSRSPVIEQFRAGLEESRPRELVCRLKRLDRRSNGNADQKTFHRRRSMQSAGRPNISRKIGSSSAIV